MADILQTTLTSAFCWLGTHVLNIIWLKSVPKISIDITLQFIQVMACRLFGDKPLPESIVKCLRINDDPVHCATPGLNELNTTSVSSLLDTRVQCTSSTRIGKRKCHLRNFRHRLHRKLYKFSADKMEVKYKHGSLWHGNAFRITCLLWGESTTKVR